MKDRGIVSRLFYEIKPAKVYLLIGLALYLPVTVLNVIQPLLIGFAVQHGMLQERDESILELALVFLGAVVLLAVCELLQGLSLQTVGQRIVFHIRKRAFDKVQRLSMGFLDSTPMGQILTRLTNDAETVTEMFSLGAIQIFGDCLFLVGTFVMLFFVNATLTWYSALSLPILAVGIYFFRFLMIKSYIKIRELLSNINSFLQEYFSGMATLQISGRIALAHQNLMSLIRHICGRIDGRYFLTPPSILVSMQLAI